LPKIRRCFIGTAFQICIGNAIGMAWENQMGLKLNGTHQLLVCAAYVNLLGDNINTEKKKKKETVIDISKEFGREINTEKSKYLLLYCH
jgi:hypothetical protein